MALRSTLGAFLLAGVTIAATQERPAIVGRWNVLPLNYVEVGGKQVPTTNLALTPGQTREVEALANRVEQIFRRATALNPPIGYEAMFLAGTDYITSDLHRYSPGSPIPITFRVLLFELYRECDDCPVLRDSRASAEVSLLINDQHAAFDPADPMLSLAGQPAWFLRRRIIGQEQQLDVYEGDRDVRLIFPRWTRPLSQPVTRDQYVERVALVTRREAAEATRTTAHLPAEQASALAAMEAAAKELARVDPAAAAALREQIIATRSTLTASKEAAAVEAARGQQAVADYASSLDAERAALSADARRDPALVAAGAWPVYTGGGVDVEGRTVPDGRVVQKPSGLVPNEYHGRYLVTLAPAFFDRTVPGTHPQLLVVTSWSLDQALQRRIHDTLDWAAVTALVWQ